MPRLEGKVALISGAARGQGRSHTLRLAEEAVTAGVGELGRLDIIVANAGTLNDTAPM